MNVILNIDKVHTALHIWLCICVILRKHMLAARPTCMEHTIIMSTIKRHNLVSVLFLCIIFENVTWIYTLE